jgi:hypothetical protein
MTDSQSASPSWCQAPIWDLWFFLFEIFFRQLRVCYFVEPSLTRRQVCNLLLLLVLASAVSLRSESHGAQDHILTSQFLRLPQPGGPGHRIYIPQEQDGPDIPPGTGFPFCCLLQLAGLRWRYSILPPHGRFWSVIVILIYLKYATFSKDLLAIIIMILPCILVTKQQHIFSSLCIYF